MSRTAVERILGDPFAKESKWLAACNLISEPIPTSKSLDPFMALQISIVLACCTSAFAMFSYDWGREVLEELIRRDVQFAGELVIAAAVNMCIVLPAAFGLYSGFLCQDKKNEYSRCIAVALAGLTCFVALFGTLPWFALASVAVGSVSSCLTHKFGAIIREETTARKFLRRSFAPSLFYLMPAGFLFFFHIDDGNFGFREELGVFLSLVLVSCVVAASSCNARSAAAGLSAAFFSALPALLVSMITLLGLSVVAVADPVHAIEALVSSLIVMLSTVSVAAVGGYLGASRSRTVRLSQSN